MILPLNNFPKSKFVSYISSLCASLSESLSTLDSIGYIHLLVTDPAKEPCQRPATVLLRFLYYNYPLYLRTIMTDISNSLMFNFKDHFPGHVIGQGHHCIIVIVIVFLSSSLHHSKILRLRGLGGLSSGFFVP